MRRIFQPRCLCLKVIGSIVLKTAASAGTEIEVTFIVWPVAEPDPVIIVIALWLTGTNYPHLGRSVCEIRIDADRVSRDVRYAHTPLAVPCASAADIEAAVGRVVRIESHAKNPGPYADRLRKRYREMALGLTIPDDRLMVLVIPCCSATKIQVVFPGAQK